MYDIDAVSESLSDVLSIVEDIQNNLDELIEFDSDIVTDILDLADDTNKFRAILDKMQNSDR